MPDKNRASFLIFWILSIFDIGGIDDKYFLTSKRGFESSTFFSFDNSTTLFLIFFSYFQLSFNSIFPQILLNFWTPSSTCFEL